MKKNKYTAFTLAEMMVVMLIMSIILAAMAPVMTTRNKTDNSSPWRYSPQNSSNAYFGAAQSMKALIGQVNEVAESDNGKLVINTMGTSLSHILFKSNNSVLGDLYFNGSSIVLGNRRNPALTIGGENINIGHDNWSNASNLTGASNITIGDASMQSLSSGSHNIGIGTTLSAVTTGDHNIAVGDNALTGTTGAGNIAIGGEANQGSNTDATIAIGLHSSATGTNSIAIGSSSNTTNSYNDATVANGNMSIAIGGGANGTASIAMGHNSHTHEDYAISIGADATCVDTHSLAIGTGANTRSTGSIAIGTSSIAGIADNENYYRNAVAVGYNAQATGAYTVSVGENSKATVFGGTALGRYAWSTSDHAIAINGTASGYSSIAVGVSSKSTSTSSIAIGNGAEATYTSSIAMGADTAASGSYATALGSDATASGIYSTAVGYAANARGTQNTAIGYGACSNVTGSNKTCIGANSGPSSGSAWASDSVERVFIGGRSKFNGADAVLEVHNSGNDVYAHGNVYKAKDSTVVINGNLVVKGHITSFVVDRYGNYVSGYRTLERYTEDEDNASLRELYSGNDVSSFFKYGTGYSRSSDRRLKYVGKENTSGLDKIKQLKVFNYIYKKDTTKTPHVGVIAQDLQKVFPNAVKKGADGFLTIRMEDIFFAVVNAIKELDSRVTALEKENKELKARLDRLEAKVK